MKKSKLRNSQLGEKRLTHHFESNSNQINRSRLDADSLDYFQQISNLIKNTNTPNKYRKKFQEESDSSDCQIFKKKGQQTYAKSSFILNRQKEIKNRRYSHQSLAKKQIKDGSTLNLKDKGSKYKYELQLDDYKKTVSLAKKRNQKECHFSHKYKAGKKHASKRYISCQYYEESDAEPSIADNIQNNQQHKNTIPEQSEILISLNEYIMALEKSSSPMRPSQSERQYLDNEQDEQQSNLRGDRFSCQQMEQILKENYKLKKRLKSNVNKTEELEEQINSHLLKSKHSENSHKDQIRVIASKLKQASSTIYSQEKELKLLKDIFKSFGKKIKQFTNNSDDASDEDLNRELAQLNLARLEDSRTQKYDKSSQFYRSSGQGKKYQR